MARAVDLPKTTALRLLTALEELGMVERVEGRYLLGHGLAALTRNVSPASELRAVAKPYLAELAAEFGENASVAIDDGDELLYIETASAPGAVQVSDWTGRRVPFHTDAAGLVIASSWSDDRLTAYASSELVTKTDRTISTRDALITRAEAVRAGGGAWTFGEFAEDVNGVAAPVVSGRTTIGAVNVYGPAYRWPGDNDPAVVAARVEDVCARISARFTVE